MGKFGKRYPYYFSQLMLLGKDLKGKTASDLPIIKRTKTIHLPGSAKLSIRDMFVTNFHGTCLKCNYWQ